MTITASADELEIKAAAYRSGPDEPGGILYQRSFRMGANIDNEKIEAKVENGVLRLVLPKKEEMKPREIRIDAAD